MLYENEKKTTMRSQCGSKNNARVKINTIDYCKIKHLSYMYCEKITYIN